jgi:hypothetical protein
MGEEIVKGTIPRAANKRPRLTGTRRTHLGRSTILAIVAVTLAGGSFWLLTRSFRIEPAPPVPHGEGLAITDAEPCRPPSVRPAYLPWVEPGQPIPPPTESYDAEIDRAQLSWADPNRPPGQAGVGLTVYPHAPMGNWGEETDVVVEGVAGRLHSQDEGGLVGISWDLSARCNYMELALAAPGSSKDLAIQELMRIARSLA